MGRWDSVVQNLKSGGGGEALANEKVEKCCGQSESLCRRWDNRRWGHGGGVALWMPRWLRLRCGAMGGVLKVKLCDSAETIGCGRWEGVSHTRPFLTGLGFETLGERCEQSGRWR